MVPKQATFQLIWMWKEKKNGTKKAIHLPIVPKNNQQQQKNRKKSRHRPRFVEFCELRLQVRQLSFLALPGLTCLHQGLAKAAVMDGMRLQPGPHRFRGPHPWDRQTPQTLSITHINGAIHWHINGQLWNNSSSFVDMRLKEDTNAAWSFNVSTKKQDKHVLVHIAPCVTSNQPVPWLGFYDIH